MFLFLFAFHLVASAATAAEPVVLTFDPTPYAVVPPPGFGPMRVSASAKLDAATSGACSCDEAHLTCSAEGGVIHAAYTLRGLEDFPVQEGVIGQCSVGGASVPVAVHHRLSVWHQTYQVSQTDRVVTYERGRPAQYSFAFEKPEGSITLTSDPKAPVSCEARGTGVTVVVNDPTPEDGVYPCVSGDSTVNVRLLGFDVTGTAAQTASPKKR
jgi:hypothetical protein